MDIIMDNQNSRLGTLKAKSDFVVALSRFLQDKSGPMQPENLPERLGLGLTYSGMSRADHRILVGTLARLGWRLGKWPRWFKAGSEAEDDAELEALPSWITRKAA
jgi:hypothetical protein